VFYRKKYCAQQKIIHSYGANEDDNDCDEMGRVKMASERGKKRAHKETPSVSPPPSARVRIGGIHGEGGRYCKCGSTDHQRTSHKDYPQNKKNGLRNSKAEV